MKRYVIDRFEGSYAICEDESKAFNKVPKYKLPLGCKEGDTLVQDSNGMFHLATHHTIGTESRIREKMNRLIDK